MFLRDEPTMTLTALKDALDMPTEAWTAMGPEIKVDIEGAEDLIRIGPHEIPASLDSLLVLCDWLQIPAGWVKRADADLRAYVINKTAERTPENVIVRVTGGSVMRSISTPLAKTIEPRQLIDVAANVLSPDAVVDTFEIGALDFRFDAIVPYNAPFGVGGDVKVGDITRAALRFAHSNKGNLAPSVQRLLYRLACTNMLEIMDPGLKIDARGGTVEQVLADLEATASRAFASAEADIGHFYDLRSRVVDNPERTLNRAAREAGLSERLRHRLMDRVPVVLAPEGHDGVSISEFDLVNMVTNAANDPELSQWGAKLQLQRFGGAMVRSQVERCATCASKLTP